MKKLLLLFPMFFIALVSVAQDATQPAVEPTSNIYETLLLIAIMITLGLALIAALVLLRTVKIISEKLVGETVFGVQVEVQPAEPKPGIWERLLDLKPLAQEKDIMMEHTFDGIAELDNPTPGWFMWLFYSTIAFAICYMAYFHVFHFGKMQEEEYAIEMKTAAAEKEAYLAKSADKVDENSVKQTSDNAVLNSGKAIFQSNCVACHGDHAQGVVGPNLTDEFWLHGGKINNLFKTIKYGVPEKGMISWEKTLSPKQISDVANYILSLKGSMPASPKAPQGTKES
jgi:cytochrome c oxidase cbb3-type subunit 3